MYDQVHTPSSSNEHADKHSNCLATHMVWSIQSSNVRTVHNVGHIPQRSKQTYGTPCRTYSTAKQAETLWQSSTQRINQHMWLVHCTAGLLWYKCSHTVTSARTHVHSCHPEAAAGSSSPALQSLAQFSSAGWNDVFTQSTNQSCHTCCRPEMQVTQQHCHVLKWADTHTNSTAQPAAGAPAKSLSDSLQV